MYVRPYKPPPIIRFQLTMMRPREVKNTSPKRNVAANIHVEHTQLRDLISCPAERGEILFASTSGLSTRNLALDDEVGVQFLSAISLHD